MIKKTPKDMNRIFLTHNKEKGAAAILITLLVMTVVLLIALGLSAISITELRTSKLVKNSAPSFYAADAGVEYALYQIFKQQVPPVPSGSAGNASNPIPLSLLLSASYYVSWTPHAGDCSISCTITSTGLYGGTTRRVQLTW